MEEIRAFIGHSFSDVDEDLIRRFTQYFDRLSETLSHFSWEHAVLAEPTPVSQKVLSILDDKNVFIGICTKSECYVEGGIVTNRSLFGRVLLDPTKLKWKTSDWVLQEIGLAVGRNMEIILFVEEGVRSPSGLLGDAEYIQFARDNLEQPFNKLLEMVAKLVPKSDTSILASPASPSSQPSPQPKATATEVPEWPEPNDDWTLQKYEMSLFTAIIADNQDRVSQISKAFQTSKLNDDTSEQSYWEARSEVMRIMYGKGGNFQKLKDIANSSSTDSRILDCVADAHFHFGDFLSASNFYEDAATHTVKNSDKLNYLGNAARASGRANDYESVKTLTSKMRRINSGTDEDALKILRTLSDVFETLEMKDRRLTAMGKIVAIDPSDNDTRFQLAFSHSRHGDRKLALLQYLKIPFQDRSGMAWNNIGVEYRNLSLHSKSVDAYQRGAKKGISLAMNNLAEKYLDAGFLDEARRQSDSAFTTEDPHENIGSTLSKIMNLAKKEENKLQEMTRNSERKLLFFERHGEAMTRELPADLAPKWKDRNCSFDVSIEGTVFKAEGSYTPHQGLKALLLQNKLTSEKSNVIEVRHIGELCGSAINGTVNSNRISDTSQSPSTILTSAVDPRTLICISKDGTTMSVLEIDSEGRDSYYELTPTE